MKYVNALTLATALALCTGSGLAQQTAGDMQGMKMGAAATSQTYHASGTVKKIDAAKGKVTFAHGPVKDLGWPAMVMGFKLKDKTLLDQLAVGKQVTFDFVKQGNSYVVTAVR